VFLSAPEQPVRQAAGKIAGKIMYFPLLEKNFEMYYIIDVWLEDSTLSTYMHIHREYCTLRVQCAALGQTCSKRLFLVSLMWNIKRTGF